MAPENGLPPEIVANAANFYFDSQRDESNQGKRLDSYSQSGEHVEIANEKSSSFAVTMKERLAQYAEQSGQLAGGLEQAKAWGEAVRHKTTEVLMHVAAEAGKLDSGVLTTLIAEPSLTNIAINSIDDIAPLVLLRFMPKMMSYINEKIKTSQWAKPHSPTTASMPVPSPGLA